MYPFKNRPASSINTMRTLDKLSTDHDDIRDWIYKLFDSFEIKVHKNEVINVQNFGDLIDYIIKNTPLKAGEGCSRQQSFYKLRELIANELKISKNEIQLDTILELLIPRKNRRNVISKIGEELGTTIDVLNPTDLLNYTIWFFLILSFGLLFKCGKIGLIGFAFFINARIYAHKYGKKFTIKTFKDLVIKVSNENYSKIRRNKNSQNQQEIEPLILEWANKEFDYINYRINRETKLWE
jgi:hypothetical protein